MIIVMNENATVAQLGQVIKLLEDRGLNPRPNHGSQRVVIGIMKAGDEDLTGIAEMAGVDEVVPLNSSFKMVSKDFRSEPTVVNVGGVEIGGQ